MRGWRFGWAVAMLWLAGAGPACACGICNEALACSSGRGGSLCIGNGESCLMVGRCPVSYRPPIESVIQITLLDAGADPGIAVPARLARAAGEVVVGRPAARLAGTPLREPIYSAAGFDDGGTVAFRSPRGDGFTLARAADGRGAWLTVCALAGHRPGRVLARERLDADDALVVRVPFDGRTCVLVLGTATLPGAEALARLERVQRELRGSARPGAEGAPPPFELEPLQP